MYNIYIYIYISVEKMWKRCYQHQILKYRRSILLNKKDSQGVI